MNPTYPTSTRCQNASKTALPPRKLGSSYLHSEFQTGQYLTHWLKVRDRTEHSGKSSGSHFNGHYQHMLLAKVRFFRPKVSVDKKLSCRRDRATLRVIEYFAKSQRDTQGHSR